MLDHNFANALPGYLVLGAKARAESLADLPSEALHEFAELLARAQRLVQDTLNPERLYISRYGHSPGYPIHFHIIPVYPWVEELFWEDERYRLLDTFASPDKARTRTDGAELTLFIWREFGERRPPLAVRGPSIEQVIERLRAAFI